jgi:F0F1-type ATP synthase assembly protein I
MFWADLAIVFMTAMSGVSLGLVVSSLVADPKTAANIVPLVLIGLLGLGVGAAVLRGGRRFSSGRHMGKHLKT